MADAIKNAETSNTDEDMWVKSSDSEEDEDEHGPATEVMLRAQKLNNALDLANSYREFSCHCKKTGLRLSGEVKHYKVPELSSHLTDWIMQLMTSNMKTLYEIAEGWRPKEKKAEMMGDNSRYLIAFVDDNPVAFTHFQFDMDYGREVLYCYEIQLEKAVHGCGLGKHIMLTLDKIAKISKLSMVVLTVFKHNENAVKFFTTLGYEMDETSPDDEMKKKYLILSKRTSLA